MKKRPALDILATIGFQRRLDTLLEMADDQLNRINSAV